MKSRVTAGILAILVGGLGVHKFYLGKIGMGILYLVFCWTGITAVIGLIEGILYLTKTDDEFQSKYVSA
jgi:TM2 domain-containing membrane protein YozV